MCIVTNFSQPGQTKVNTFTATFDSDCDNCGGEIYEGEDAGYLPGDKRASCSDCVEEFQS